MPLKVFADARLTYGVVAGSIAALGAGVVCSVAAVAASPVNSIVKIVNGKFNVDVDNGWVVYQDQAGATAPSLRRFVQDPSGSFTATTAVKLKTAGAGAAGNGSIFNVGGIAYAPCPVAASPSHCAATDFGTTGVGLAFGQTTFGAGAATAGWVNDATVTANFTDADFNTTGSVADVAADATNGAFAVGWSVNPNTGRNQGLVMKLDAAGQTYKVLTRSFLGTLGGPTSQALAVSRNGLYTVGMSDDAAGKVHAVFATTDAAAWTDITGAFPSTVIKSRAFAVSNTGIVAGSATVKRSIGGAMKSVDIGFTYNTNTMVLTFFEAPGADVVPLRVLDDGRVVGNLELVKLPGAPAGLAEIHPFIYDGTVHDFGTMTLTGGLPAYSCRVNRPNGLGEMVGSCIPNNSTPYGVQGTAFYINGAATTPTYINLNASIHANNDVTNSAVKAYIFGTATSIDDQHEISLIAMNKTAAQAAFIASKPAYNP
ncbi:MAG TPA: hypothetical protein VHT51_20295 [Micropepsaceae bacterium]|jgi:hypothetical protein|nr:hypothetical protein [Micropepsaceae bacterium]